MYAELRSVIYIEIKLIRDACLKRYNEFWSDNVVVSRDRRVFLRIRSIRATTDSVRLINHSVYVIARTNPRRCYKHLGAERHVVGAAARRGEECSP